MPQSVVIYYLEMTDPSQLRSSSGSAAEQLAVTRVAVPDPERNRFFYRAVGAGWQWHDRLSWNLDRWREYVNRPELTTWIASVSGTPAGYFELEDQADSGVQIVYFGLVPQFIGRGLGRHLLAETIRRAWASGTSRVWVHTCSLDHPAALANYKARGFRVYKTKEKEGKI